MLRLLLLPPLRLPPSLHSALLLQRHASSKSSQAYIARQKTDHFVAARGSFRSRAAFKLVALAKKYKLLKDSVVTVVDLGSSPGGWSQVLTQGKSGKRTVVAVDLLEMEKIDGVHFVKGDFLDPRTRLRIRDYLIEEGGRNGHNKADLVLSDSQSPFVSLLSPGVAMEADRETRGVVCSGSQRQRVASQGRSSSARHRRVVLRVRSGSLSRVSTLFRPLIFATDAKDVGTGLSTRFAKTGLRVGHVFKDGTRRPGGTLVLVPSLLLATPFLPPKLILTFLHSPHSILLLSRAG